VDGFGCLQQRFLKEELRALNHQLTQKRSLGVFLREN
jgi:hypothetical protein